MLSILPVLLISVIMLFPKDFIIFSGTILGKWMAIIAIVWATSYDWIYGLFVCSIIIYYYQLDIVQDVLDHKIWQNAYEAFSSIPLAVSENMATLEGDVVQEETPKYLPYNILDTFMDFVYQPSTPTSTELDDESKLEKVELHDILQQYLRRENRVIIDGDDDATISQRERMLALEDKMRVPENHDDWVSVMTQNVVDTVTGWGTSLLSGHPV